MAAGFNGPRAAHKKPSAEYPIDEYFRFSGEQLRASQHNNNFGTFFFFCSRKIFALGIIRVLTLLSVAWNVLVSCGFISFYNRVIGTRVKASQYKRRAYLFTTVTQLRLSRHTSTNGYGPKIVRGTTKTDNVWWRNSFRDVSPTRVNYVRSWRIVYSPLPSVVRPVWSDGGARRFIPLDRQQEVCIMNAVWNEWNHLRIPAPMSLVSSSGKHRYSGETATAVRPTRKRADRLRLYAIQICRLKKTINKMPRNYGGRWRSPGYRPRHGGERHDTTNSDRGCGSYCRTSAVYTWIEFPALPFALRVRRETLFTRTLGCRVSVSFSTYKRVQYEFL